MAGNLHRAHLVIRGPKANAARLPRRTRPLIRHANLKRRSAPMPLLVLIRHGQSAWKLEKRFTGCWGVYVDELGAAEARAAGRSEGQGGVDSRRRVTRETTTAQHNSNQPK